MEQELNILLVEDSENDADLLIRFLQREEISFTFSRVWQKENFLQALRGEKLPDLIIADHTLPQFNGMEAFLLMKEEGKDIPFILVTGTVSEKLLTQYMKEGIDDYLLKDNLLRLPAAIQNVLNKKRNEQLNAALSQTNSRLEKAMTDIQDSIRYAKIIQDAILPDQLVLHQNFPKSFIFYKPKHILSGDFYWFEKKNDLFFIAAVDCTGHGIPGALLSMMGNNLISEAVNVHEMTQPSLVLDFMNGRVRKILKHGTSALSDGMDMTFCSIDVKNMRLMYAGANRPLFLIRERKLIEFKPDKISIGGIRDEKRKFINHDIPVQNGDMIFIFSDGFADQFNEKTNKKMTVNRLRELLTKCASLPLAAQESIITAFFEVWKGSNEQIDDVLLMGICIDDADQ